MLARITGSLLFALLAALVLLAWVWGWLELASWAGHAFGADGIFLMALGWPIFTIAFLSLTVPDNRKQGMPG